MPDITITIRPHGPYIVQGPVDLRDSKGNTLPGGDAKIVALCRCGGSANKPFCDGAHGKISFQSEV
jgi:CDGSH-type Zn-finger protein